MVAQVLIPEKIYRPLRRHLFQGGKEQGAFLFAKSLGSFNGKSLIVDDYYLIPQSGWDIQESYYLELNDVEKVKVMQIARKKDCDLIECHSHRNDGKAFFSSSDVKGLEEFVEYVHWKLPGKKYGALVWTESSVHGQIWDGKNNPPFQIREVTIIKSGTPKLLRVLAPRWEKIIKWFSDDLRRG